MKKLILALIICILANISVFAENTGKVTGNLLYNRETSTVDVSGTAAEAEEGSAVLLMLLRPGYTAQMLDNGTAKFFDAVIYAGETAVGNGEFVFDTIKLNPNLAVGDYTLRIATDIGSYEKVINVATVSQANELMKNAESGTAVKNLVESYNDVYGLDMSETSLFSKLSAETREDVFEKMAADNPGTKEEIKASYELHTVLCKITEGPWTALEDIIKTYETVLKVTASDISNAYSAEEVYKSIVGKSYNNAESFKTAFEDAIDSSKAPVYQGGGTAGGSVSSGKGGGAVAYIPQTKSDIAEENKEIFGDIASHVWAKDSIEKLYNAGIVSGKAEGIFAPDDYVTRAESAKMIALTFGCYNEAANAEFDDVQKNEWSYSYIGSVAENGIVSGYGNGIFGKNDLITRQDIAVMIYRAAEKFKSGFLTEGTFAFEDNEEIAQYAREAVAALSEKGIINGIDGRFMPTENATRAQMAKMLAAFVE